jgi:hypothetical protein
LYAHSLAQSKEDFVTIASVRSRVTRAAEGLPRRRFTVAEVEAMVAAGGRSGTSTLRNGFSH